MGFSSQSSGSYKPVHYFSIKNEMVEGSKTQVIGKFFAKTVKDSETGKYSSIYMKNENGHPTPFIGKLSKVEPDYDFKITEKSSGRIIPSPKVKFTFEDEDANYVLDMKFCNDKGQVDSNLSTMLNSLASCKQIGTLKLSIVESEDKNDPKVKRHNLYVRNAVNYNGDDSVFFAPKDGSLDTTKTTWMYDYAQIPKTTVTKIVDGDEVEINNVKAHQQFFKDLVNLISEKLKNRVTTFPDESSHDDIDNVSGFEDEVEEEVVAKPVSTKKTTKKVVEPAEVDESDLPF